MHSESVHGLKRQVLLLIQAHKFRSASPHIHNLRPQVRQQPSCPGAEQVQGQPEFQEVA